MKRNFRTYPDSDDAHDILIGYRHIIDEEPPTPIAPEPTPGIHGGTHASYILAMAREGGEFTVKELTQRYGLGHQGAYFYEVLNSLIAAGLIAKRAGRSNVSILRATEATYV